jgi:hypothetical protein
MTIEWLRDLVIVIFGIGGTVAALALTVFIITITVFAFLFYKRLKPVMASIKNTTETVERITATVEETVAKPLAQIISFVQGIRSALGLVKKFTGKEEEK